MSRKNKEIEALIKENKEIKKKLEYTLLLSDKEYHLQEVNTYFNGYNTEIVYKYFNQIHTAYINTRPGNAEMFYWGKHSFIIKVNDFINNNDRLYVYSKEDASKGVEITDFALHMSEKTCVIDKCTE